MLAKELAEFLMQNPDYEVEIDVYRKVPHQELCKRRYQVPYDITRIANIENGDVSHSERKICIESYVGEKYE